MAKHDELDARIVAILKNNRMNWNTLHNILAEERGRFAWRTTDSRLQALRKRGVVRPVRVGSESLWEVVA